MHKYNKIRGILRAKQGSQIPKYYYGGNPYMIADPQPSTLQDATSSFNPSMLNSNLYNIPGNIPTYEPSFWQKAKIVGKGLGKKAINFASENQGLVTSGINTAMNSIDNTKNSKTFNIVSGGLQTASKIPGVVGLAATGANALLRGINKLTSKTIDTHTMSEQEKSKAGNYGGMLALNNKVSNLEGVEFGGIGGGSEYREGVRNNNELLRLLNIWRGISNTADNQFAMAGNGIYLLGYEMLQNGGYPTQFLRASKQGGTLTQKIDLVKSRKFNQVINVDTKLVEGFKEGGKIQTEWEPVIEDLWEPVIDVFQKGGSLDLKPVYDYYKDYDLSNAVLIHDSLARAEGNKIYVNTDEDAVHELWHFLSQNKPNEKYKEFYDNLNDDRITELGGDLNFVKRHEGDPGHFYHPSELEARIMAAKFKSLGLTYTKDFFKNLRSDENKYGYNMRDLLYMFNDENLEKIFNLKKGGTLGEDLETPEIEETNQKNLIPEGALHKNKHHMEHTEGLTLKGIPVIDNEGEQLAEIELDEIIFTLEVTKKLEELYRDGSDEAAIEAGKLLVKEILFNTDDRTGLISKCEKGGKL